MRTTPATVLNQNIAVLVYTEVLLKLQHDQNCMHPLKLNEAFPFTFRFT